MDIKHNIANIILTMTVMIRNNYIKEHLFIMYLVLLIVLNFTVHPEYTVQQITLSYYSYRPFPYYFNLLRDLKVPLLAEYH